MSIATEISRIQTDRNTIRAKLVELGMANNTDNLTKLAAAIEALIDQGAVSVEVKEGESYTIPRGYHNGSGTVKGVSGGGNYTLQTKSATPTKKQQSITPDSGYYGLSAVTVAAIPDAYQDVSSVNVTAGEVLVGKIFVPASGTPTTGTMANNGAVDVTLTGTVISYTIPAGYHNGQGAVKIVLETKTVTPTKSAQDITPTAGKVLSRVTVAAIPEEYQDITGVTATEADVLAGKTIVDATGASVEGTMPDNGAVGRTLTASAPSYTVAKGYHNGAGTVSITPETRTATPTKSKQTISPSTGKVLSTVTVEAIPDEYQDVTGVTAFAADVLEGKVIVDSTGEEITGTMPDNGDSNYEINGLTVTSVEIPTGYTSGGTVALTSDIEEALAAI